MRFIGVVQRSWKNAHCALRRPHSAATVAESIGVAAMTKRIVEVEAGEIEIETMGQEIVLETQSTLTMWR
jgi:hypothetical protein